MKGPARKAIVSCLVGLLWWCASDKATSDRVISFRAPSAIAEGNRSTEERKDPVPAPEGSGGTVSEPSPEKAFPLKDFVPSEKIEPDKAVDFPVDI